MNRATWCQAVAMLVMLWAGFRALPSGLERFDTLLGYGDWQHMLFIDRELWENRESTLQVRSQARGMARGMGPIDMARMSELLKCERYVRRQAQPGDLVQFKGMMGNEAYVLQYYLYPLRTTSHYWEHGSRGGDATRDDAMWVITGGAVPKAWETAASAARRAARGEPPIPADSQAGGG